MQERTDLKDAAQTITHLFNIGVRLGEDDRYWSDLKNNNDYSHIYGLPNEQKWPMERIYSEGRSFCGDLKSYTNQFIYDPAEYPTVSEIVKTLESYISKRDFDKTFADAMEQKKIANFEHNYAFNAMCEQFQRQIKLVSNLKLIINTLRNTDQFKSENDMPTSKNSGGISITHSNNVNVSSGSPNSYQTITGNDGLAELIGQMIEAVKASTADNKDQIIAAIEDLQDTKIAPASRYANFIARVKDHMPLFTPFIAPLTTYFLAT